MEISVPQRSGKQLSCNLMNVSEADFTPILINLYLTSDKKRLRDVLQMSKYPKKCVLHK